MLGLKLNHDSEMGHRSKYSGRINKYHGLQSAVKVLIIPNKCVIVFHEEGFYYVSQFSTQQW